MMEKANVIISAAVARLLVIGLIIAAFFLFNFNNPERSVVFVRHGIGEFLNLDIELDRNSKHNLIVSF